MLSRCLHADLGYVGYFVAASGASLATGAAHAVRRSTLGVLIGFAATLTAGCRSCF